ncbi:MAG: ribonuclease P protein component [bacterium]|nr:ribonuclease P protein component [bacterium]
MKENRLRKKKDFETIFKNGKTFKEGFLILKIIKNNLETNRFGFIISQKVSKKATVRNRIKRKLREVVRLNIKEEEKRDNKKTGVDVALIMLTGIDKKDFSETKENLIKLFKKVGLV